MLIYKKLIEQVHISLVAIVFKQKCMGANKAFCRATKESFTVVTHTFMWILVWDWVIFFSQTYSTFVGLQRISMTQDQINKGKVMQSNQIVTQLSHVPLKIITSSQEKRIPVKFIKVK